MPLSREIPFDRQTAGSQPGILALTDLPAIYQEFCRELPPKAIQRTKAKETRKGYDTDGYGYQWCIDLLNEVAGLGHWRILSSEAFCQEGEYSSGRKAYEAGYDVTVQLGNWTPDGFEILAETPGTPGGHISTSKADARKGALTNAIKKALAFFGIGAAAYRGELDDDNLPPEGRTGQVGAFTQISGGNRARAMSQGGQEDNKKASGQAMSQGQAVPQASPGNTARQPTGKGANPPGSQAPATDKQIDKLKGELDRVAKEAGYTDLNHKKANFINAVLAASSITAVKLEELTKNQASMIIENMPALVSQAISKALAERRERQSAPARFPGQAANGDTGQAGRATKPKVTAGQKTAPGDEGNSPQADSPPRAPGQAESNQPGTIRANIKQAHAGQSMDGQSVPGQTLASQSMTSQSAAATTSGEQSTSSRKSVSQPVPGQTSPGQGTPHNSHPKVGQSPTNQHSNERRRYF